MKLFTLEGKTALVTGSSQGIGLALATGLAEAGAKVILNGRDQKKLDTVASELQEKNLDVTGISFDVIDEEAVESGVAKVHEAFGPIDILINNAGGAARKPIEEMSYDDWKRIIDLNLNSAFLVTKAISTKMKERRSGKIINMGSLMSEIARTDNTNYAASKGGIRMFTKALAVELGPHNVQVNGIGPGYFSTPLTKLLWEDKEFTAWLENRTPMGRWGKVEELVGTAVFLASAASDFVSGQMIYVDGGFSSAM